MATNILKHLIKKQIYFFINFICKYHLFCITFDLYLKIKNMKTQNALNYINNGFGIALAVLAGSMIVLAAVQAVLHGLK